MTIYMPRSAWTTRGPVKAMSLMVPSEVQGLAIHWPGTTENKIDSSQASIAARLESYRAFHTSNDPAHGWSDIAYTAAADQAGRVWDCRGIRWRSAANGNASVNRTHGAILLLLGDQEAPSAAMIRAVQDWRQKVFLRQFPKATKVVGHRDLHGTDCPGPRAYELVRSGVFAKTPGTTTQPKPPPPPPKTKPPVDKPKPPVVKEFIVANYVYGEGRDIAYAAAVGASHGMVQIFDQRQVKAAAAEGHRILVLGGPAVGSLALAAPSGQTTTFGNITVANGATSEETITRGMSAAAALQAA